MSELDDVNLYMVNTPERAQEFLRWLGERRPVLAIDTETTGLEWWTPNFTRLVQFGDGQTGWTIPLRNWRGVAEIALNQYAGPVTFWNAPFDMHALVVAELPAPYWHQVHDARILHHLEDPNRGHSLKSSSVMRFGPEADVAEKMLKAGFAKHGWTWATVPESFVPYGVYAAMDTVLTARWHEYLHPSIIARGMEEAYERERGAMEIMWRAECRGIQTDPVYALALRDEWDDESAILRGLLRDAGIENPGSNKQVIKKLEEEGWDPEEFTPTGIPKLDKIVLGEIQKELGVTQEIAAMVQRYRRITKWSGTYLDAFLGKRSDANWRTHASINTLAARTGRMSITGPPLQTLPQGPQIRQCILPYEGDSLYCIDYDAQEVRLFAHFAQEEALLEAMRNGLDAHTYTASLVYGIPYEEIGKKHPARTKAKVIRLAQLYGAGDNTIAVQAGVPVHEIHDFILGSDAMFPRIPEFMAEVDIAARTRLADYGQGHVWSWGGRYLSADPNKLYKLVNYLIQGSAADLLKDRLIRLSKAGYDEWIMVPVHDELLFSVPAGQDAEVTTILEIMEARTEFSVPIICSASGPYKHWGEAV